MIPKEVFHYTTARIGLEKILFERKLKIGQFRYTNDPKESKEYFINSFVSSPPSYDKSGNASDWYAKLSQEATKIRLNEWKVLCVSKNHPDLESGKDTTDNNPFLSGSFRPRMWAHYGENHRGICINLDGAMLDEQIKKTLTRPECELFHGDVEYDDLKVIEFSSPPFNLDNIAKLNKNELEVRIQSYFYENYDALFLKKSRDWESEYEFRWLVHSKKDSPEFITIDGIAKEVLVGCDFPEAYYPSLLKFCDELRITASKIEWYNGMPIRSSII